MTRPDASLQRLIDRLTSMAEHDRTYVLDRLGPIGRDKLEPLLADSGLTSAPSSPLQALVRQVAGGQNPPSMTPKASAALRSLGPFAAGLLSCAEN